MTNLQKWQCYMSGVPSPQSYVDFGYYALIAAALQRRVWCPPAHAPIYPNEYIIFVGEAGLGKGAVLKPIAEILKYHKVPDPRVTTSDKLKKLAGLTKEQADIKEFVATQNFEACQEKGKKTSDGKEFIADKLAIPVGADDTTYEALVRALTHALRWIDRTEWDEKTQRNKSSTYTHSSLCFCLEELSSLFDREAKKVAKLLLNAYDCGDYEYDTKHQGKDRIRKCCLNFLGGTTPSFMQEVFGSNILNDGFASRTHFIYETSNRHDNLFFPPLTEEQKQCKQDIIDHVGKLTELYGPLDISQEDMNWLQNWYLTEGKIRENPSTKMNSWYSRLNQHIPKLAMAIHFGESTSMKISRDRFIEAREMLRPIAKKMHYALDFGGTNPLFLASKKLVNYLNTAGRKTCKELLAELYPDLPNGKSSLDEIIEYLLSVQQIKQTSERNQKTQVEMIYYESIVKTNGANH